jgi:cytochrome P450
MMEVFVKTDFEDLGEGDGGISFETDPVKHREVAKRMAPAFSMKNFKAKEATLQYYVDMFIDKMKEVGGSDKGAEMRRWADWLSMDIAADMTYNRQMNEIRDSEPPLSIHLDLY